MLIKGILWLVGSKRLTATLTGAITVVVSGLLASTGVILPPGTIEWLAGIVISYVISQGMADLGKEKAAIEDGAKKRTPFNNIKPGQGGN